MSSKATKEQRNTFHTCHDSIGIAVAIYATIITFLFKYSSNTRTTCISFHHIRPYRIRHLQHRCGSKRGLQCIKCNFVRLDPIKGDLLLGDIRKWRCHVRKAYDETAVVVRKSQEGLNLNLVGRPWPLHDSFNRFLFLLQPISPYNTSKK
jgi:hypothetical protein